MLRWSRLMPRQPPLMLRRSRATLRRPLPRLRRPRPRRQVSVDPIAGPSLRSGLIRDDSAILHPQVEPGTIIQTEQDSQILRSLPIRARDSVPDGAARGAIEVAACIRSICGLLLPCSRDGTGHERTQILSLGGPPDETASCATADPFPPGSRAGAAGRRPHAMLWRWLAVVLPRHDLQLYRPGHAGCAGGNAATSAGRGGQFADNQYDTAHLFRTDGSGLSRLFRIPATRIPATRIPDLLFRVIHTPAIHIRATPPPRQTLRQRRLRRTVRTRTWQTSTPILHRSSRRFPARRRRSSPAS